MPSPQWPTDLPGIDPNSYEESPPTLTVRDEPDVGPSLTRRIATAGSTAINGEQTYSLSEVDTLFTFHDDILAHGSLTFLEQHPRTQTEVTAKFRNRPEIIGAVGRMYFRVSIQLEILP